MTSFIPILTNTTSIALLAFVVIYAWHKRTQTAALQLMAVSFFMLVWAMGTFSELLAANILNKIFWRNFTQIGAFYTPPACLLFSIAYSGMFMRIRKRLAVVLYAVQSVGVVLIFTDSWLHLMRVRIDIAEGTSSITVVSTTLSKMLISLNFVLLAASLLLLIIYAVRASHGMRKQVVWITISMGVAAGYALIKVSSGEHFAASVPISGVFGIVCLAMLLCIIRYDFLRVLPVARAEVFNIIEEGIIVASPTGAVLDINEAAVRFLSRELSEPLQHGETGFPVIRALLKQQYAEWYEALASCRAAKLEFPQTTRDGNTCHYQCGIRPLDDKKHRTLGTISVIRDITEQKIQNDLLKQRAERDGQLGIFNRQTFFDAAERSMMQREDGCSLVFFDIDDFKTINDTFGHIAGDATLREVCACVQRIIGPDTLFGRIGGEEFAVFYPDQGVQATHMIAERMLAGVAQQRIHHQGQTFGVTISIGIASGSRMSLQQLYQRADRMLYQAKASGKNCIVS